MYIESIRAFVPSGYAVCDVNTFDYSLVSKIPSVKRPRGNNGSYSKNVYIDSICAFDIETSAIPFNENSLMYIWQFCIDSSIVIGRTWREYKYFVDKLAEHSNGRFFVVYVHNLSYEFQFLSGQFRITNDDVFAVKKRKVLKLTIGNIEYRCSYLLTNSSLEVFTKDMGARHKKKPGNDINYRIYRTPDTVIHEKELEYCLCDVLGLCEALKASLLASGDTLYTVPLTSTGYVRRDTKTCMRILPHTYVKRLIPDFEINKELREAFRGGNTHANRYYSNCRLYNVYSYDRASSYPDVQVNKTYPVSQFCEVKNNSIKNIIDLIYKRKKAILMRIRLYDIELKDKLDGFPYIPRDKCRNIKNAKYDNGRVLSAECLEITVTDIDFRIIIEQYVCKVYAFNVYMSSYGRLPECYIRNICRYFEKKTELKGIDSQYVEYCMSKSKLNSIYGMSAQNPIKQDIIYTGIDFVDDEKDEHDIYLKYCKKAFIPYQWGVWCTAWARYELQEGLKMAGRHAVYCDTDSVKSLKEIDFGEYNSMHKKSSTENGACAKDRNGQMHYMGTYDYECKYSVFKTLGAKKYVYKYEDNATHVTIAGVSKKLGGIELDNVRKRKQKNIAMLKTKFMINKKLVKNIPIDGIDFFRPGFVFRKAGGNEAIYNDNVNEIIYINGKEFNITNNITIKESEYTVGLTDEYSTLLAMCEKERASELWI